LSIDFVTNRRFIKLFITSNTEVIKYCQEQFSFDLPSVTVPRRTNKFLANLCQLCYKSYVCNRLMFTMLSPVGSLHFA